jgi:hypothetical protein
MQRTSWNDYFYDIDSKLISKPIINSKNKTYYYEKMKKNNAYSHAAHKRQSFNSIVMGETWMTRQALSQRISLNIPKVMKARFERRWIQRTLFVEFFLANDLYPKVSVLAYPSFFARESVHCARKSHRSEGCFF